GPPASSLSTGPFTYPQQCIDPPSGTDEDGPAIVADMGGTDLWAVANSTHSQPQVCIMQNCGIGPVAGAYAIGAIWAAGHTYNLYDTTTPSPPNGFYYKATSCSGACTTGSTQPTFSTLLGNTSLDGNVTWTT